MLEEFYVDFGDGSPLAKLSFTPTALGAPPNYELSVGSLSLKGYELGGTYTISGEEWNKFLLELTS